MIAAVFATVRCLAAITPICGPSDRRGHAWRVGLLLMAPFVVAGEGCNGPNLVVAWTIAFDRHDLSRWAGTDLSFRSGHADTLP